MPLVSRTLCLNLNSSEPSQTQALSTLQKVRFSLIELVQQQCIPKVMLGVDVLCQAKSGMGKTAVFVLATLHQLEETAPPVSALVLCHTRELAYQIKKEYDRLGKHLLSTCSIEVFYGGKPLADHIKILKQKPPTVVVGTPGRILQLLKLGHLNLSKLKHFVLDECDKMLSELDMRRDVQNIFKQTPHTKQVMMFSATMPEDIKGVCRQFMRNQFEVFIDSERKLTLQGLQQYFVKLEEREKTRKLINLLDALVFNQVIIFVKDGERGNYLNRILNKEQFPSICIYGHMKQEER